MVAWENGLWRREWLSSLVQWVLSVELWVGETGEERGERCLKTSEGERQCEAWVRRPSVEAHGKVERWEGGRRGGEGGRVFGIGMRSLLLELCQAGRLAGGHEDTKEEPHHSVSALQHGGVGVLFGMKCTFYVAHHSRTLAKSQRIFLYVCTSLQTCRNNSEGPCTWHTFSSLSLSLRLPHSLPWTELTSWSCSVCG